MDKNKRTDSRKYNSSRSQKTRKQERNTGYNFASTLSSSWRSGSGEGLWDISNDTPNPFEGRLDDYEISDHS